MLKVIGKDNCSSCEMTKTILDNKGIKYEYLLFEDLGKEFQTSLKKAFRSFPILLKDRKATTLQEVISECM